MFRSMFDDDPFFRDSMTDMHQMMGRSMMEPHFGSHRYAAGDRRFTEPTMSLSPFGMMGGGMFGGMNSMMRDMELSMRMMQPQQGMPGSSFQSSFTSISYGGNGEQPKVYQASSSTRMGSNGIKETQKTERNSVSGLHKMAIGHHIGERAHIMEKAYNRKTGDREESQEYVNLDEEDAENFNQEWKKKTGNNQSRHTSVAYHPIQRQVQYPYDDSLPAAIEYPGASRHRLYDGRGHYTDL